MYTIKKVTTKKELKKFIEFPSILYRNNDYFVPKYFDFEQATFSNTKNDALSYCEVQHFLAFENHKVVGRVCTIINHRYNKEKKVKQIRFTRLDAINDFKVFELLINKVKEEASNYNLDEIIGPLGLCSVDEYGLLIEGFDKLGDYFNSYNNSYYIDNLKALGFTKENDYKYYRLTLNDNNEQINKMASYTLKKYNLKIKDLKKTDNLYNVLTESFKLSNSLNAHRLGYNTISDKQIKMQSEYLKALINYSYCFVVLDESDNIVGYCYACPSLSKAIKKSKGKASIKTKIRMYYSLIKNKYLYIHSIGVSEKYQNISLDVVMLNYLINKVKNSNIKYLDTSNDLLESDSFIDSNEVIKELIKTRRVYKLKL